MWKYNSYIYREALGFSRLFGFIENIYIFMEIARLKMDKVEAHATRVMISKNDCIKDHK